MKSWDGWMDESQYGAVGKREWWARELHASSIWCSCVLCSMSVQDFKTSGLRCNGHEMPVYYGHLRLGPPTRLPARRGDGWTPGIAERRWARRRLTLGGLIYTPSLWEERSPARVVPTTDLICRSLRIRAPLGLLKLVLRRIACRVLRHRSSRAPIGMGCLDSRLT